MLQIQPDLPSSLILHHTRFDVLVHEVVYPRKNPCVCKIPSFVQWRIGFWFADNTIDELNFVLGSESNNHCS